MFYDDVISIHKKGTPVYIWGGGEISRLVRKRLDQIGVPVENYIIDNQNGGINPLALAKRYAIVRGWLGSFYISDDAIKNKFPGCQYVITLSDIYEPDFSEPLDEDFYTENIDAFLLVREFLSDEISQKTFDAYVEAKMKHNNSSLLPLVIPTQYFFNNCPWHYHNNDVLVDCGAFDGDSIRNFISLRGNNYDEIIAFEPDKSNFEKLHDWINASKLNNINAIQAGVFREKTTLNFNSSGNMESYVSYDGNVSIPVESIDNVCAGRNVSIIKMDIEGSELDALIGGKKTIEENTPILMISTYHKKNDLFVLMNYIREINPDYQFYLRAHKPLPIDVVLYAVPKNRIK